MLSVFGWTVDGGAKACAEQARSKTLGTNRALQKPVKALPAGDGLVGAGRRGGASKVLIRNSLRDRGCRHKNYDGNEKAWPASYSGFNHGNA